MSFNIGLSGLRAATSDLNVTGNNIANAGTAGFKQSRAEFADLYASSMLSSGSNPIGSGVLLSDVSQLFSQGNINYTQNSLDLAINGSGFFRTSNNGDISYTRAGYFGTDREGFIVNNFGHNLQGYSVDANGNLQNGIISNLKVETASQAPRSTSTITQPFNLNSTEAVPVLRQSAYDTAYQTAFNGVLLPGNPNPTPAEIAAATAAATPAELAAANAAGATAGTTAANASFNPADPTSYNRSTSVNIFDAQGNAHSFTQYFVKTGANNWDVKILVDGRNPLDPTSTQALSAGVTFDSSGKMQTIDPANLSAGLTVAPDGSINMNGWVPAAPTNAEGTTWAPNGSAASAAIKFDFRGSTQFNSTFSVAKVVQDGYSTGELAGLQIDETGQLFARYTNGQTKIQGQLVLANFANMQGLTPVGKTAWVQSSESGEPVIGTPKSGTLGSLQSGALEDSNVELSDQLVNLIVAQRNYQANAKTIETESAITQTIINLR
ncbi:MULTISPECIES: flagellar hook protein FlgE [Pseudomonadaceae]|uniref:Flagellar hook protein FlgE n=1 Tax=Pseudomonas straminea TaxID=47882 RepID=A0A1I1TGP7_PSEOC|nr:MULTISPECIES: flagellar hook protein FlgE [Pseudomonas]MDD1509923.1 flagellar hook protein FlgE [Pseudomonas sp. CNPSo 3701]TWE09681.1 flagellar hook protein FlgE [Pseudomonas sp. AG1028]GLX13034.1 flagellar hook protein FlgE [Pseudomonas straminea]SFD57777.1 flagellar hook protein FlgE [Pseudomonas straminea]